MALTLENCFRKTIVSALSQRGSDVERREPNGFHFRLRPARFRRDTIHFGREIYQLPGEDLRSQAGRAQSQALDYFSHNATHDT